MFLCVSLNRFSRDVSVRVTITVWNVSQCFFFTLLYSYCCSLLSVFNFEKKQKKIYSKVYSMCTPWWLRSCFLYNESFSVRLSSYNELSYTLCFFFGYYSSHTSVFYSVYFEGPRTVSDEGWSGGTSVRLEDIKTDNKNKLEKYVPKPSNWGRKNVSIKRYDFY